MCSCCNQGSNIAAWACGRSLWVQWAGKLGDWDVCWHLNQWGKKWVCSMLPNLYVLPQIHVDLPALLFPVTGHYRRFGLVIGGDLEIINASPHWEFEEQPAVQIRTVWRAAFTHNATGALRYVLTQVFFSILLIYSYKLLDHRACETEEWWTRCWSMRTRTALTLNRWHCLRAVRAITRAAFCEPTSYHSREEVYAPQLISALFDFRLGAAATAWTTVVVSPEISK